MHPEMATDAAIAYLRQLHSLFGDWNTALAAYNCGEGAVGRALRRQRVEYLDSFWDLYPKLPRETARYVPRFIATLHIVNDPQRYGFHDLGDLHTAPAEVVEVHEATSLSTVARALGLSTKRLRELNPHLRGDRTPPRGTALRVPQGHGQILMARLQELERSAQAEPEVQLASAKSGSARVQVARAKASKRSPVIRASAKQTGKRAAKPKTLRYKVRKGDTIGRIARRYGISEKSLKQANRMRARNPRLSIGQVLTVPRRG
jgi:membrane-bound lytic murein transglycosylase D